MAWNIVLHESVEKWLEDLTPKKRAAMTAALDQLAKHGPTLGRPAADRIAGSRVHHMKELRSFGGHQRALFAFDQNRTAVVVVAGDKTNNWKGWYRTAVPLAERRFADHNRGRGGDGPWRGPGGRSGGR